MLVKSQSLQYRVRRIALLTYHEDQLSMYGASLNNTVARADESTKGGNRQIYYVGNSSPTLSLRDEN